MLMALSKSVRDRFRQGKRLLLSRCLLSEFYTELRDVDRSGLEALLRR